MHGLAIYGNLRSEKYQAEPGKRQYDYHIHNPATYFPDQILFFILIKIHVTDYLYDMRVKKIGSCKQPPLFQLCKEKPGLSSFSIAQSYAERDNFHCPLIHAIILLTL